MQSNGGRSRRAWVLLRRRRVSSTWMFIESFPWSSSALLHRPAVTDDHGLAGQGVRRKGGEEERDAGDIVHCGELAIHGLLEHHGPDHRILADPRAFACSGIC